MFLRALCLGVVQVSGGNAIHGEGVRWMGGVGEGGSDVFLLYHPS